MKLLLILGSDDNYEIISQNITSLGFDLIRYRHVLKAMDNIDEIDPQAVIISARDFPRHVKVLTQFVRNQRSKEECPIAVMEGESFSAEETSELFFLGGNGVISGTLESQEDIDNLKTILGCAAVMPHSPVREKQTYRSFSVESITKLPQHRVGLLIAGFSGKSIVNADVKTISAGGLSFTLVHPLPARAVKLDKELKECSLRTGSAILSPVCRITGTGKIISLEFVSFPNDERRILEEFLEGC